MTIFEPCSNGLGSDAFCILWDGEKLHGLNASGRAPAAWTPDYFRKKYGEAARQPPMRGWDSVTVPGAVAGWVALSRAFRQAGLSRDLLAPAIEIAERGYAVPVVVQAEVGRGRAGSRRLPPGFAEAFMPGGRAPDVGERFAFSGAARALESDRADARALLSTAAKSRRPRRRMRAKHGGAMTRRATSRRLRPSGSSRSAWMSSGHRLHEIPPNGQGIAALIALGILQHFDLAAHAGR